MKISNIKLATQHFINGKFVNSLKNQTFKVINPVDESIITQVQKGTNEDIDFAIQSAKNAFYNGPWNRMDPTDRAKCLFKLADLIQQNTDELATIQATNNGKSFKLAKSIDVYETHGIYRYYAGWVDKIRGNTISMDGPFNLSTRKEPVGIVGQIIPWNVPLIMQAYKLAPALAAGCTVVMKTAEQTPLSALKVAQLINEAGIPKGVVNIVSGYGDIGAYLARHPNIDKVSFTGSLNVGMDIIKHSHVSNLKRITLELGGKSPHIITKNADLEKAVNFACNGTFFNAGQVCVAGTRVFVHSDIYDEFVERMIKRVQKIKLGDPFDPNTNQGPQISRKQMENILKFIKIGVQQGATLMTGGKRYGNKGFFIEPTIFTNVSDNMTIAKQQIFGPVQCIFKYKDIDEVIQRANDTQYGLGAGIMSQNFEEAEYMTKKIKAGTIYRNCYSVFGPMVPFGGYKNSGIGRQMGEQGLNAYLELKTIIEKI